MGRHNERRGSFAPISISIRAVECLRRTVPRVVRLDANPPWICTLLNYLLGGGELTVESHKSPLYGSVILGWEYDDRQKADDDLAGSQGTSRDLTRAQRLRLSDYELFTIRNSSHYGIHYVRVNCEKDKISGGLRSSNSRKSAILPPLRRVLVDDGVSHLLHELVDPEDGEEARQLVASTQV